MSKPRFARLGGVMRSQADIPAAQAKSGGEPPEDSEDTEEMEAEEAPEKKDDPDMKDKEQPKAKADEQPKTPAAEAPKAEAAATVEPQGDDAVATARAEERQRIADVFASEHVKGREMAAAELLAGSDMKAGAIVAMLPKLTPAAEADEGKAMLTQMREGADPDLGQGAESEQAADENHGWGKAHAKAAKLAGRTPKSK